MKRETVRKADEFNYRTREGEYGRIVKRNETEEKSERNPRSVCENIITKLASTLKTSL